MHLTYHFLLFLLHDSLSGQVVTSSSNSYGFTKYSRFTIRFVTPVHLSSLITLIYLTSFLLLSSPFLSYLVFFSPCWFYHINHTNFLYVPPFAANNHNSTQSRWSNRKQRCWTLETKRTRSYGSSERMDAKVRTIAAPAAAKMHTFTHVRIESAWKRYYVQYI